MYDTVHTFFKPQPEEERYKVLRIPIYMVGDFLFQNRIEGDSIYAIKLHGMPDKGVRLQAMAIDPMSFTVSLRLYHPSWPIVPLCEEVPLLDVQIEQIKYRILDKETCQRPVATLAGFPVYLTEKDVGNGSYIDPSVAEWHPEAEFPPAEKYEAPEPKKQGYEFL